MSFIANGILKEVIIKKGLEDPAEILYALDEELFLALNKNSPNAVTNDGMDVALGVYDFAEQTFSYSGAFRPLLLVREGNIIELEANRYPIGFYADVEKSLLLKPYLCSKMMFFIILQMVIVISLEASERKNLTESNLKSCCWLLKQWKWKNKKLICNMCCSTGDKKNLRWTIF